MSVDHWRPRKTGPEHPLMVARCAVHEIAFTVYPPGHYPYGRRALAPCRPDGHEPVEADRDWSDTVFEGAVAAASRQPWARFAPGGSDRWWSTQGRLLEVQMALTGTHPDLADDLRHRVAETLRVPALLLRDQARQIREKPGFVARGRAVVAVLRQLYGRVVRRLLAVGWLLGLWGKPLLAFPTSGTDPPGR